MSIFSGLGRATAGMGSWGGGGGQMGQGAWGLQPQAGGISAGIWNQAPVQQQMGQMPYSSPTLNPLGQSNQWGFMTGNPAMGQPQTPSMPSAPMQQPTMPQIQGTSVPGQPSAANAQIGQRSYQAPGQGPQLSAMPHTPFHSPMQHADQSNISIPWMQPQVQQNMADRLNGTPNAGQPQQQGPSVLPWQTQLPWAGGGGYQTGGPAINPFGSGAFMPFGGF